jgi:hypothetical protein
MEVNKWINVAFCILFFTTAVFGGLKGDIVMWGIGAIGMKVFGMWKE